VKIGWRKPSRRPSNFPKGAIKGELSAYIGLIFLFWLVANIKKDVVLSNSEMYILPWLLEKREFWMGLPKCHIKGGI
jgi:hypothetical protein